MAEPRRPDSGHMLVNEPARNIADPLEAARAISEIDKPPTPDAESAKGPDPAVQPTASAGDSARS